MHKSDLNKEILNIPYNQISFYLKANGWIHDKTVDGIDIYHFENDSQSTRLLLPQDDTTEEYKHRLVDILLVLQYCQSSSLFDISWQIKKFCLDFTTQEQSYE